MAATQRREHTSVPPIVGTKPFAKLRHRRAPSPYARLFEESEKRARQLDERPATPRWQRSETDFGQHLSGFESRRQIRHEKLRGGDAPLPGRANGAKFRIERHSDGWQLGSRIGVRQ